MSNKSTIRILAYTCIAIPALLLFLENRFFEAGAIGWLWIVIGALTIVESIVGLGWRRASTSPHSRDSSSNGRAYGSPDSASNNSPKRGFLTPSENSIPLALEHDMNSDKQWSPLSPKELIDYVSLEGATEIARAQRSAMYKDKLLQVRGFVNEVDTFTFTRKSNYRVDLKDSTGYPWSWSVWANVRSDQDEYVRALRKGDEITITGTIDSISTSSVTLAESYIDHSNAKPHPKNLVEPLDRTNVPAWFLAALARSLRQIDGESDAVHSARLIDALDRQISEIGEEVDYLGATKPRGEELRFMLTLLNRWYEHPPTYPKPDKS